MTENSINRKKRLYLIGALVLLIGLGSSVAIYLTAEDDGDNLSAYETVGPGNSKLYMHDLQLYGGKANVLADEFRLWFLGLWQGKSLAYTITAVSLVVAAGFFFVAYHMPAGTAATDGNKT